MVIKMGFVSRFRDKVRENRSVDGMKAKRVALEKKNAEYKAYTAEKKALSSAKKERFEATGAGRFLGGVKKVAGEVKASKAAYAKKNKGLSRGDVLFGSSEPRSVVGGSMSSPFALNKPKSVPKKKSKGTKVVVYVR